jgi:hypothetical protein
LRWQVSPENGDTVETMNRVLDVLDILPFQVNLWEAQNAAYEVAKDPAAQVSEESATIALRLGIAPGED